VSDTINALAERAMNGDKHALDQLILGIKGSRWIWRPDN